MDIKGIKLNGDEIVNFENMGGGRLYRHNIKFELNKEGSENTTSIITLLWINDRAETYADGAEFIDLLSRKDYVLFDGALGNFNDGSLEIRVRSCWFYTEDSTKAYLYIGGIYKGYGIDRNVPISKNEHAIDSNYTITSFSDYVI